MRLRPIRTNNTIKFILCIQGRGAITRTDLMIVLSSIADLVGVQSLEKTEEVLDRLLPRLSQRKSKNVVQYDPYIQTKTLLSPDPLFLSY